jgi:hypothetical protein
MFRTIQTAAIRVAIVLALTSSAACSLEHDPGLTEEFVRTVRAEGLADGYGDEEVSHLFEDLCDPNSAGWAFDEIQHDYPKLDAQDFPRMRELATKWCN